MTLVSNLSPRILRIFASPVSTSLRMAGVISYCLPVYSTFIEHPPGILDSTIWAQTTGAAGDACRQDAGAIHYATSLLCAGGYSGCACPPGISQPCGE